MTQHENYDIPIHCPAHEIKFEFGERLSRIEVQLETLMMEIRRAKNDKYIYATICSMITGTMVALITYILR